MAFIAVGAAVALAATVVAVGMASSEGDDSSSTTAVVPSTGGSLPAGHPSIAATLNATAAPAPGDQVQKNIARLEDQSAADPADVDVLLDLGDAYFLGQHLQQAGHAFTRVLQQDPGNATAQVGLAMVWHARGDSGRAETALRAVIAAHPDSQEAHYSLAIVNFSEGHVDEARTEWKAAARIDPTSSTGRRSQSFVDLLDNQQSATPSSGN